MSGDVHDFNNIEARAVISYIYLFIFFLQGKAPKKIHVILKKHHHMPLSKTGRPSLNVVIIPPVMRLVLDDPKH
jgi:hypothetical protein